LAYLGQGNITPDQIPHRTKLSNTIMRRYKGKYEEMMEEIRTRPLGRISFTSDVWSSADLTGYMAVTAHYIVR
ncbi:hypothetical protein FB107DRAFT_175591, partial [Schizophyllum commune]